MMRTRGWGKWLLFAAMILVMAAGCGTKEAVKSTESVQPQAGTAVSMEPSKGSAPTSSPEAIKTETIQPESGMSASQGTETAKGIEVAKAGVAEAAGVAATEEKTSAFNDIRFDFDKSAIRDDAKPILAKVAAAMKKGEVARLLIEGHCDERGTAEYNMALGERRAESARAYLVSLGVASGSLSTVSFGKEKPLDPEHTEAGWAKNRRGHFVRK